MLCERCKKKVATVFVTKVINDQKTEHVLCIECAKAEGSFPTGFGEAVSVDSLLKGFFHAPSAPAQPTDNSGAVCPLCGMDTEKLAEKGRFGCSECYKVFTDAASRTIRHIHGRKRHIGKLPKRGSGALSAKRKLADLRTALEAHVLSEEYEEAAKLRDQIRALEKEMLPPEVKNDGK